MFDAAWGRFECPFFSKYVPDCSFSKLTGRGGDPGKIGALVEGGFLRSDGAIGSTRINPLRLRDPFVFQATSDLGEQRPAASGSGHDLAPAMAIS